MRFIHFSRRHAVALAASLGWSAACFSGQADPDSSGVFACVKDVDCAFNPEFRCLDKLCAFDVGPALSLVTPELGQRFAVDSAAGLTVTVSAKDLVLAAPTNTHEEGKGYLIVVLDDRELGTLTSGDAQAGVSLNVPAQWIPTAGIHRLAVQVMRLDKKPYRNSAATLFSAFWVDDGKPHIGIISPHPLQAFAHEEAIDLTVRAINFQFVKASAGVEQDPVHPKGHLHAFFNPLIPDCLGLAKSCKGEYVAVLEPPLGPPVDEIRVSDVTIPVALAAGNGRFSVVAQNSDHTTFPSNDPGQVVYDTIAIRVEKRMGN